MNKPTVFAIGLTFLALASCSSEQKKQDKVQDEGKTAEVVKDSTDNKGMSEKYVFQDAVGCIHLRRTCRNLKHVYKDIVGEVKAVNPNGGYQIIYVERNKVPKIKDDRFFCVDCISEEDYEKLIGPQPKKHLDINWSQAPM